MRRPTPLPEALTDAPFDRAALAAAGLGQGRLSARDIERPFQGVHTTNLPATFVKRCEAYAVRLKPGQFFTHSTAGRLLGIPLPRRLEQESELHVAAVRPASPPRTKGVVGHKLARQPVLIEAEGLPVCVGSEVWCQLAEELSLDELIVIADHLLHVSPYDEARTRAILDARIGVAQRAGAAKLRAALAEARYDCWSPGETRTRLLIVRAGIPEPRLNTPVRENGVYLGKPDMMWLELRVTLEYEGFEHLNDPEQVAIDIARYERFQDAGWTVIRVTAENLWPQNADELVQRVANRLGVTLPR